MAHFRRRLRGAIKNALVWTIGWTVLGFAATMILRLTGIVDLPVSVLDAMGIGVKVGLGGGIAGTAFAAYIAFAYRNRRIQEIKWWTFGLGGAVVTAASITAFMQGASLLSGSGLVPWRYLESTLAMFAVFGFVVATASMKLAQVGKSRDPDSEEGLVDDVRSPGLAAGAGEVPWQQRARAEVRATPE